MMRFACIIADVDTFAGSLCIGVIDFTSIWKIIALDSVNVFCAPCVNRTYIQYGDLISYPCVALDTQSKEKVRIKGRQQMGEVRHYC